MPNPEMLHVGEWAILETHWPGRPPQRIGLLLHDQTGNTLRFKVRGEWFVPEGEDELWRDLHADLERMAADVGVQGMFEWLESTASHVFRLGPRKAVLFSDIETALEKLYIEHLIEGMVIKSEQAKDHAISHNGIWQCALSTSGSLLALAANIAFVAIWSVSHHSSQLPARAAERVQKESAQDSLPPLLSQAFPTKLLDVPLAADLSSSRQSAAAVRAFRHRNFHLEKRRTIVKPNIVRASLPSPPSLLVVTQATPSDITLPLPRLPEFRRQHRFVHALMYSVRTIARVFADHENKPAPDFQQHD